MNENKSKSKSKKINKIKKWDEDGGGCLTCMWRKEEDNSCMVRLELGKNKKCHPEQSGRKCCYANKEQITDMLQWSEAKSKTNEIPKFQVGDAVSVINSVDCFETYVTDLKGCYDHSVYVKWKSGSCMGFKKDGTRESDKIKLYHGHDLEAYVKEKLPVRLKKNQDDIEEKSKAKAKKPWCAFRVGDPIYSIRKGNAIIAKIAPDESYPIKILFPNGHEEVRTIDGKFIKSDKFRDIYHGHDLDIASLEKIPIRPKKIREDWVILFLEMDADGMYSKSFTGVRGEEKAMELYDFYKSKGKVISYPIKVEVEEE